MTIPDYAKLFDGLNVAGVVLTFLAALGSIVAATELSAKVPYLLVVGDREVENGTVAVRARSGEDLGSMPVEKFAQHLAEDVGRRGRTNNQ